MKVAVLILLSALTAKAATYTAANTTIAGVSNAYALATAGDTIQIPAGTSSWTNTLHVTNVWIKGAGMDQTVLLDDILDDGSGYGHALIHMHSTSNQPIQKISNLKLTKGARATSLLYGAIQFTGTGKAAVLEDVLFLNVSNRSFAVYNFVTGVAHNVTNWSNTGGQAYLIWHDTWGDGTFGDKSWSGAVDWGGTNAWVIEHSEFTNYTAAAATGDAPVGSRLVFRFNKVLNAHFDTHGTESTSFYRGVRGLEVYGNSITNNTGVNFISAVYIRGGTAVCFSNTISGYDNLIVASNYREDYPFSPWQGATGTNAWDSNEAGGPFDTGTHTGSDTAGTLTSSGQGWTVNQWLGYSVMNESLGNWNGSGVPAFKSITANTADTISVSPVTYSGTNIFWKTGDTFKIFKVNKALDGIGYSTGDFVQSTGTPTWPNQALEPIYEWNNTQNGAENYSIGGSVTLGVEVIEDTAKPGFTPLGAHPLIVVEATPGTISLEARGPVQARGGVNFR